MYAPLANFWTLYVTFEELIKTIMRQLTLKCRNAAMLFKSWPTSNTDLSNLQPLFPKVINALLYYRCHINSVIVSTTFLANGIPVFERLQRTISYKEIDDRCLALLCAS